MSSSRHVRDYSRLSAEDRREFDRWLHLNAAYGWFLFLALIAMVVAGAWSSKPGLELEAEQAVLTDSR
jgi:hypothetical protein